MIPNMEVIVKNKTCYNTHREFKSSCKKSSCKYWMNCKAKNNCVLIAAKDGSRTLQEIGDLFGLTRMRICQIEKSALGKLKQLYDHL